MKIMVKYIEFGEYNKNYNYIILAVVVYILSNYLPQISISLLLKYNKITEKVGDLYNHSYIIAIFISIGQFAFSCILNIYDTLFLISFYFSNFIYFFIS